MSLSQLGQDRFALEALGGLRGGYFLDSGACDGLRSSNTHLLETAYGWSGICVEPDPTFFAALVRNRRAACVNCCLWEAEGEAEFVAAGTLGGLLEAYSPEHLAYVRRTTPWALEPDGRLKTWRAPTRPIAAVLSEQAAPRVIDYWSLDTEGSELAILKSFPFDTHQVRVITVEHNRHPVRHEIRTLLEARGYVLVRDFGIDDGYVLGALVRPRAWRSAAFAR